MIEVLWNFPRDVMAKRQRKKNILYNLKLADSINSSFEELAINSNREIEALIAYFLNIGISLIRRQPDVLRILVPQNNTRPTLERWIWLSGRRYRHLALLASTCGKTTDEFMNELLVVLWSYHRNVYEWPHQEELLRKIDFDLALRFSRLHA